MCYIGPDLFQVVGSDVVDGFIVYFGIWVRKTVICCSRSFSRLTHRLLRYDGLPCMCVKTLLGYFIREYLEKRTGKELTPHTNLCGYQGMIVDNMKL